jgi:molybdopterin-guanine dinucleotide biosynthesis protein A
MVEWAVASLTHAGCAPTALLGGSQASADRLGLAWRADTMEGAGPLAGIAAGLGWARERGQTGILVLACDLPLVTAPLLSAILEAADADVDVVVPTQATPPGLQPLCAWYAASALARVLGCLERGERSVRGCLVGLRVREVHRDHRTDDLELLNVNTPDEIRLAERVLSGTIPAGA